MPESQFRGNERQRKKKYYSFPVCEKREINVYLFIRFLLDVAKSVQEKCIECFQN
jgi:hypothetical protein